MGVRRTNVLVLSDIHANNRALEAVLADAKSYPIDRVIVLGDLLTYGVDVTEVLLRINEIRKEWPVDLVLGNHDQFYFDLAAGRKGSVGSLPAWIRESVEWTARQPTVGELLRLPFVQSAVVGHAYFAHANPHGVGDWAYLNSVDEFTRASRSVQAMGLSLGIFGHTHRVACAKVSSSSTEYSIGRAAHSARGAAVRNGVIITVGSVGQPRDQPRHATYALVQLRSYDWELQVRRVPYDVQAAKSGVESADLSDDTRRRIQNLL